MVLIVDSEILTHSHFQTDILCATSSEMETIVLQLDNRPLCNVTGVRTKSIWTKSIVYTQTKSIGYRTKSISHIFLYKHLCDIYLSNMNCIGDNYK